ncbi:MAG: delta-60 repeat domain-containing protein [Actinomycetes bacterium]
MWAKQIPLRARQGVVLALLTVLLLAVTGAAAAPAATAPVPGTMDATFNIGTGPTSPVPPSGIQALAVQPDGKIVIGGYFTTFNGTVVNGITRINPDGSRDTSFNVGTGTEQGSVAALAIQPDGKIVVGGFMVRFNGIPAHGIARLNPDGSVDQSFNQGSGFNDQVLVLAVQPNGRILVAGDFADYDGSYSPQLARLMPDGTFDSSFVSGRQPDPYRGINTIALPSDGKIVLGGSFDTYGGAPAHGLVRVNSDGSPDPSFSVGNGVGPAMTDQAFAVIPGASGTLLVGGYFATFNGQARPNLVRLNADGSIDPTFGTVGTGPNAQVNDLQVQRDGRPILLGNFSRFGSVTAFGIVRLNPDGTLDPTFVSGTGFTGSVIAGALQADGKLLVGGFFDYYNGTAVNQLLRLYGTPIPTPQTPVGCRALPKKIRKTGLTVILPRTCLTNAGQAVQVSAAGRLRGDLRLFRLVKGRNGKVSIRTYGYRIALTITESAPAINQYSRFRTSRTYRP